MQNISNKVNNNSTQPQQVTIPAVPVNNQLPIPIRMPQQTSPLQSSGVNIVIYNPSVNPTAGTVANSNNTYGAPMSYPQNYYLNQPQRPATDAVAQAYLANSAIKEDVKSNEAKPKTEATQKEEKQEETHKENIIQLTDDYVKTLENYLNNQNPRVREMGVKELFARFKEHKSRYNDIALTNLLNKALQDGSKNVRFVALTALDSGYACGDNLTKELLQRMQASKDTYGEDAIFASEVLLKMAGKKVEIEVPGPAPEKKSALSAKKNVKK